MTQSSRLERRTISLLAIAAFVLVFLTWQFVGMSGLLYPVRLFVSLVHELGHGLTAIATGGHFIKFEVFPNGAGLATTAGGSPFLVPQMGYLGAALFGAVLLVLTNRARNVRYVALGVALLIGGCVVGFTATNTFLILGLLGGCAVAFLIAQRSAAYHVPLYIVSAVCALLTVGIVWQDTALKVGLGAAVILALLGLFAPPAVIVFILNFIALIVGLNAIMDIWYLLGNMGAAVGSTPNDAVAIANFTNTPPQFWAILWVILAVGMMGVGAYVAFIQPVRQSKRVRSTSAQTPGAAE